MNAFPLRLNDESSCRDAEAVVSVRTLEPLLNDTVLPRPPKAIEQDRVDDLKTCGRFIAIELQLAFGFGQPRQRFVCVFVGHRRTSVSVSPVYGTARGRTSSGDRT